jgi:membrane associated rhomboid family serine protease
MFSHCNAYHLLGNMYALYTFSAPTIQYLGREHFVALYLTSGVFANLFSSTYKIFIHQTAYSLGAVSYCHILCFITYLTKELYNFLFYYFISK